MAAKIRAVVVGGGWGRNHALAYQQHPDAELVGIIGRVGSEKTQKLAQEMQVPMYLGLAETLAQLKPDALSCAAGEADHEEVTITALEAGCDVCCEKLLADTVAGAERMVAVAQRTGKQLMCSYNYRFSPSALKLRELVESGQLGHIAFATAFTFGYCLHHTLDLVCSLLGSVEEVYCIHRADPPRKPAIDYERYPEFVYSGGLYRSISLKFNTGALATLISSDYMRFGHPAVRVDLVGSQARTNMADIVGTVTTYGENREAEVWMPSLILDRLDLPSLTQTAVSRFVDALRDGQPVPVPGEDGWNRLLIEQALQQSAEENRPVRLAQ